MTAVLVGGLVLVACGPRGRGGSTCSRPASTDREQAPRDLALVVTAVAARLRAGHPPDRAWSQVLGVPVSGGAPRPSQLAGVGRAGRSWIGRIRVPARFATAGDGCDAGPRDGRVAAVLAACRVADELGAPLAPALDLVAGALAADAEAEAEVSAALAGPRASARVVGWLPVLGLLLGLALGADPIGVLTSGGAGTASGAGGLLALGCGRWWTARLVAQARERGR
ncbi:MAG: type II secretion protein F [Actinobacteria bacterium]|nr:type II secretion protein F [Actinomycetota bacterium]